MGTDTPSGIVAMAGPAVRFTCCWAVATPTPMRRTAAPLAAAFKIAFRCWSLIPFSSLLSFINHVFTGVDKHHHHHSPGKRVVGCDFTLVVGVPHERKP